jgi:hypothetical protein
MQEKRRPVACGGARRLLLVLAVLGLAASLAPAALATRFYAPTISPTAAPPGTEASATLTIKNVSATSTSFKMGSATISIPSGFVLVPGSLGNPTASDGKLWMSALSGASIRLNAKSSSDRLGPGKSVSVSLRVKTSCALGAPEWKTRVWEGTGFAGSSFSRKGSEPKLSIAGPAPLDHFAFDTIASPQTAGVPFAVTVTAVDVCDRVKSDHAAPTVLSGLGNAPDGVHTPSYGALSFSGGVASTNVTAVLAAAAERLTATGGGASGQSNAFDVLPGPPAQLTFLQQPTTTDVGETIAPPVTVLVEDGFGNDTDAEVGMRIGSNPGGGSLGGTTSRQSSAAVAVFDDLTIDRAAFDYTLVAFLGGSGPSTTSAFFDISSASAVCQVGAGCSASTGADATPANPTVAQASAPPGGGAGSLVLTVFNVPGNPCDGTIGTGLTITMPPGHDAANPVVLWLEIDRSQLPPSFIDLLPLLTGQPDFSAAFDLLQSILGSRRVTFCLADDNGNVKFDPVPFCRPIFLWHGSWRADPPCIAMQRRDRGGDLRVKFLLTSEDPFIRGR